MRSRLAYIGDDRDHEMDALEEMNLGDAEIQDTDDSGVAVDARVEDPDPFYDWQGDGLSDDADDGPHKDLFQRIGALSKKAGR